MAIRPQCSKIAMSYYKEGTFGTALEEVNIDKKFEPNEPVLLDMTQTRIDDAATIKEHEWPEDVLLDVVTAQDVSIPFSFPCSLSLAGLLYALAMGSYAHEAGIGAGHYVHTNLATDACSVDTLPSTSWILGLLGDTASILIAKGVVINELKLALDNAGRLNLTGTAFTDGELTPVADPPNYAWPATTAHLDWITGALTANDITLDSGGGAGSIKQYVRGLDFTINNNLDLADGRADILNSGVFLSTLRFGNRAYTFNMKVEGHQGDTFWGYMMDETELAIVVTLSIDSDRLIEYTFPVVKVAAAKQSFDGIRDVLDLTMKIFYDPALTSPVKVVVKNHVAEYLLDEV